MLDKFYKKKFKQDIPNDMAAELLRSIFQKKEYRTPLVKVLHDFVINGGKRRDLDEKLKTIMGFENIVMITINVAINRLIPTFVLTSHIKTYSRVRYNEAAKIKIRIKNSVVTIIFY